MLAQSRLNTIGLARGRPGSEEEMGVVVGQVRRHLSVACVRATATCLLHRMSMLGVEAKNADTRRKFQGRIKHHEIAHRGSLFLP